MNSFSRVSQLSWLTFFDEVTMFFEVSTLFSKNMPNFVGSVDNFVRTDKKE